MGKTIIVNMTCKKRHTQCEEDNGLYIKKMLQWPTCMIRSRDTAGGQAPWNCHRKCMESADSAVQRQL